MSTKKRKLTDISDESIPPAKRLKIDDEKDTESETSENNDPLINVILNNGSKQYPKSILMLIKFCKAKLIRWNNNKSDKDTFIDLRGFPNIKKSTFDMIIKLKQFLCNHNNYQSQILTDFIRNNIKITDDIRLKFGAKLLLSHGVKIDDLPNFIETCTILAEEEILNPKLFEQYLNQHSPIPMNKYQEIISSLHGDNKDIVLTKQIINTQIDNYNVMNSYKMHKKVYDRCNTLKKLHFSLPGATPKAQYAMQYIIECLDDHMRVEMHRNSGRYDHGMFWCSRNDYGLIMAFNHMIKYYNNKCNINDFLTTYFKLCMLDSRGTNTFPFYGLGYIANELWRLYLVKHEAIKNYVDHKLSSKGNKNRKSNSKSSSEYYGYQILFDCYYKITKHKALSEYKKYYQHLSGNGTNKDCKEYYQQIGIKLEKQRIEIGLKYKQEWNKVFIANDQNQFPQRINLNEFRNLSDAQWLIDNFAFKTDVIQHQECMKILQRCFDICYSLIDIKDNENESEYKYSIPNALNNVFQQYLGITIQQ